MLSRLLEEGGTLTHGIYSLVHQRRYLSSPTRWGGRVPVLEICSIELCNPVLSIVLAMFGIYVLKVGAGREKEPVP